MELGVVTGEKTIAPVHFALEQFSVGLDHLVKIVEDGGLDDLDDAELIGFLQGFERVRNRLPMAITGCWPTRSVAGCPTR